MKKLLLKTAMVVGAMLLGMTLQAQMFQPYQVHKVYNPSGVESPNMEFHTSYQVMDKEQMIEQFQKTTSKAEGNMCTITLNMEYDANVFQAPFFAYFTNDNGFIGGAYDMGNGIQGQIPQGTYNIISCFETIDYDDYSQYYVIKENVEVNGDMEITLNPAEATNHITTKPYGPNGELLKHGLYHIDEVTESYVVDEPGIVNWTSVTNILYQKGVDYLYYNGVGFMGDFLEEDMRTCPLDIYVTDVSDQFVFIQDRIAFTEDLSKSYCMQISTDNLKTCELEFKQSDYISQIYNYKYTPYGRNHDDGMNINHTFWDWNNKGNPNQVSSGVDVRIIKQGDSFFHELWINSPETEPSVFNGNIMVQTAFGDYGEYRKIELGEMVLEFIDMTAWTLGTPIQIKNGQKEFVNIGHHMYNMQINTNDLYFINNNNYIIAQLQPAPEAFIYPVENALGSINDNCPINALKVKTYDNEGLNLPINVVSYFVGRYGEVRWCNEGTTMTTKFNGEEIDLNTSTLEGKGIYDITVHNPNIEVDGLPGHNTTTVYFDQNQEDMTPPAVEMLHFKNGEGSVTDRFATAEEGTMEFYASDFNYVYYPDLWSGVFECQPVEVLVEYAPYGTENWNELTVEEVPELFQEPGWGYFYRGSLAEVTGQGLNGWFDLRFRLQDASGNWMDQVVSPAFRIDDLAYSSVATISSDNAREVARYNLAGQRVDADATGVVIIKMSDGTARKVLVK